MTRSALLLLLVAAFAVTSPTAGLHAAVPKPVDYNRDVQPILSDKCFHCHGPDEKTREAKLRLDNFAGATADHDGTRALSPGKPEESEIHHRIHSTDKEEVMPPPKSHKTLTAAEKDILDRWIAAGGEYQQHWAYVPPVKVSIPAGVNPIDHLVRQRLATLNLKPSPEADRVNLIRRLSFDLLGLPPTPAEVDAFVKDTAPDAWNRLVAKMLASQHYGERMAIGWLDVVRFADTIGYHSDNPRNIWPYRDYVIRAFNTNKPYDRFTIEQLAGDLVENPSLETRVGSAFNRLLLTTEEGGAQAKDYEARYVTDRVRAVGTVWLGSTIGCCQCHDHKYDPLTSKDFYSLGAFFADIQEPIIGKREPGLPVPDETQAKELERLGSVRTALQTEYDGPHRSVEAAFTLWENEALQQVTANPWTFLRPAKAESLGKAKLTVQADESVLASGGKPDKDTYLLEAPGSGQTVSGLRIEALPDGSLPAGGPGRASNGNFVLSEVVVQVKRAGGTTASVPLAGAVASFEQGGFAAATAIDGDKASGETGWAVLPQVNQPQQLVVALAAPLTVAKGDTLLLELRQNHGKGSHTLGRFRISTTADQAAAKRVGSLPFPREITDILKTPADKQNPAQRSQLAAYHKSIVPELAELRQRLAAADKARKDYEEALPKCLVSVSLPTPRVVRILPRGNFLDESGPEMMPAVPAVLPQPTMEGNRRPNRLDLARWIMSRENPLTARVFVNRLWKQFFGTGLSKVLDDLGAQGEPPVNPLLLDWLAVEFADNGWNVKELVRLIVSSETYRQSSVADPAALQADPYNRELARQSRWRLDAELVRDNALATSKLLVPTIGGPSVKPYQPEGYWENLNFPTRTYQNDSGASQYRRGLYTWWQRSFLHPSLVAFDAPSREECTAERNRSNIPQQALVLLNDPTYVEAARALAARILAECQGSIDQRVIWAWREVLSRHPTPEEQSTLKALFEKHRAEYLKDPEAAQALLKTGLAAAPPDQPAPELAAWTSVARVLLNLHETITRS